MSRRAKAVLIALAGLLVLPATAGASTVKVGSALTATPVPGVSTNAFAVQQAQEGGALPFPLTSPSDGVVTSWSVRAAETNAVYTFRVLRPTGAPNGYTGVGSSLAPATTTATDTVYTFATSLPIKKGDSIGVNVGPGGVGQLPQSQPPSLANVMAYGPLFADGSSNNTAATFALPMHELLVQATIKFCTVPDLKSAKTAAAQQLLAAADCTAGPVTKKNLKRTKKNKRKKKGKVLNQTLAPGTTVAPDVAVGFTVGKLKKK